MRKWEVHLRRDSEAWEDFLLWLQAEKQRETERMLTVSPTNHDLQRGIVKGIEHVLFQARANEREEAERAGRGRPPTH